MTSWTTLLFVPVTARRFVDTAHTRGAGAIVLDLEDSIAPHDVPAALEAIPSAVEHLTSRAVPVVIRIGRTSDLSIAVRPGVRAIMVPKVVSAEQIQQIDSDLQHLETASGLPTGRIGVLALVEHPAALAALREIASAPRVIGIAFGSEDFAAALGVAPTPAALTLPAQLVALAAAANGIMSHGLPDTLADYRDQDRLQSAAAAAKAFGMTGALCVHPAQIAAVDDAFAPTAREIEWASAVMSAWSEADGGVATIDGTMIDKPVALRAERILSRRKASV